MPPRDLLPSVYDKLRKLAAESPGHTLDATALVHEAWFKLADALVEWQDHSHFLRTVATAMRRILVDQARAKLTAKRDGGPRVELPENAAPLPNDELLTMNEPLEKLAAIKPEHAKLVELRFFAGLTGNEAAEALAVSPHHCRPHLAVCKGISESGNGITQFVIGGASLKATPISLRRVFLSGHQKKHLETGVFFVSHTATQIILTRNRP